MKINAGIMITDKGNGMIKMKKLAAITAMKEAIREVLDDEYSHEIDIIFTTSEIVDLLSYIENLEKKVGVYE